MSLDQEKRAHIDEDRLQIELAEQCTQVNLRSQYEQLSKVAVDLHLVANSGSDERYTDGRTDRTRARQGYRGELAVAQHYNLRPEIDYRPPGVGDFGRDFWARYNGEDVTIDVKATTTSPPKLYLTKKRVSHDRYILPDYYLLVSGTLTDDESVHLVGWASCEEVQNGRSEKIYDNPVWVVDALNLSKPPRRNELSDIDESKRLRYDAKRVSNNE